MTMIETELRKWKRNKIVWGILALTILLAVFAINRACSISRSSPYMDSFGDLYTLAFKNLTSLFLPIVLGMFATTLFFDEQKNDTLKELLIIPISKAQLYFTKVAVVILMSVVLCMVTFLLSVLGGFVAGGFPDLNAESLLQSALMCNLAMAFADCLKKDGILSKETAKMMIKEQVVEDGDRRGLVWQLSGRSKNSYTRFLSSSAYGHSGFTGCFLWNDPQRDLSIVLLSNDVYNGRNNRKLFEYRENIMNFIIEEFDGMYRTK